MLEPVCSSNIQPPDLLEAVASGETVATKHSSFGTSDALRAEGATLGVSSGVMRNCLGLNQGRHSPAVSRS